MPSGLTAQKPSLAAMTNQGPSLESEAMGMLGVSWEPPRTETLVETAVDVEAGWMRDGDVGGDVGGMPVGSMVGEG